MIKVSTTGMAVSLKTDLRFPESGQHGHGSRIIHIYITDSMELARMEEEISKKTVLDFSAGNRPL